MVVATPLDYADHPNQEDHEDLSTRHTETFGNEQAEDPTATVPDPAAATKSAAILPSSLKPSYCNVLHEPDKTALPILSDDADPWALPEKTQDLQGLTADKPALEPARWQDGVSENTTYHPATSEADGSATDIAEWKANLPPYATDLRYQHQRHAITRAHRQRRLMGQQSPA